MGLAPARHEVKLCPDHRVQWYGADHCPKCMELVQRVLAETHPTVANALSRKARGTEARSEGVAAFYMLRDAGLLEAALMLEEIYMREPAWKRPDQVELAKQVEQQERARLPTRFDLFEVDT